MTAVAIAAAIAALIWIVSPLARAAEAGTAEFDSVEKLGEALYFDTNLSKNGTQACATCHDPEAGFVDPRETAAGRAVSLGDDGFSLGDRNAPTAAYAKFSPRFHKTKDGKFVGGQFLDGREPDLKGQAGGPPLNPIEMGMPDKASVVARIAENPAYVAAFKAFYGADIFDEPEAAYAAMAASIAAFEETDFFAPFDSKYDRALRGEYRLTDQEELGRLLFFSEQFTNCTLCHQLQPLPGQAKETFSTYEYHNIGVPPNTMARLKTGVAPDHIDHGLRDNPAVSDPGADGKFKVPTLRNIAVTGPYMHNGVFRELRTAVLFHDKFNSRNEKRQINPETGARWRAPEVAANIALKELETGPALDDQEIDALVAFLKTLTDRRYEYLLDD